LEAAGAAVQRARAIGQAGIPVMGHLGLTPQTATALGGYKAQGKSARAAIQMNEDALALQHAGCFAVVFEAVPAEIAPTIAARLDIVTIGIGAGGSTSGQVLVFHDLLGITTGHMAKFVKQYGDIHAAMVDAVGRYATDVRGGSFPGPEHEYAIDEEELADFRRHVDDRAFASAKAWEWEPLS